MSEPVRFYNCRFKNNKYIAVLREGNTEFEMDWDVYIRDKQQEYFEKKWAPMLDDEYYHSFRSPPRHLTTQEQKIMHSALRKSAHEIKRS